MRRYLLKPAALLMLGCFLSLPSFAQSAKQKPGKSIVKDETVIIKNPDAGGRMVVEVKDGTIYVNGRAIMDVRDEDAARVHKKIIVENGDTQGPASDEDSYWRNDEGFSRMPPMPGPSRALLGVMTDPHSGQKGALIESVAPGSAAEAAGLRSGDLITGVDEKTIADPGALVAEIRDHHQPGDKVRIRYERNGDEHSAEAKLGRTTAGMFPRSFGFPGRDEGDFVPEDFLRRRPFADRAQGATLGVSAEDRADGNGVRVLSVKPGSAAATAGLQSGDVITHFGGESIRSVSALQTALRSIEEGAQVSVDFQRDGKTKHAELSFPKPLQRKEL